MRITCQQDTLNQALQTVQIAVPSKAQIPVLSGIYLNAEDGCLQLQASDHQTSMIYTMEAEVAEPGEMVVSGRYFYDLIRRLPSQTVTLSKEISSNTLKLVSTEEASGSYDYQLLTIPPQDFPVLKPQEGRISFSIWDHVLKDLVKKTYFSCSSDEARPIFTGCLIEINEGVIQMIATDTHRMALAQNGVEPATTTAKMIVPAKLLNEICRIVPANTQIQVHVLDGQVAFVFGSVYLVTRLIQGQFPDYRKVLLTQVQTQATIDTQQWLLAMERIFLLVREGKYNTVRMFFKEDHLSIVYSNPDIGTASESVSCQLEGNELEIAFNARFLLDILKNIDSEQCTIALNTSLSPAAIRPVGESKYTYVVTPMRI